MNRPSFAKSALIAAPLLAACHHNGPKDLGDFDSANFSPYVIDTAEGGDADTDTDADSDADSDTDVDTDSGVVVYELITKSAQQCEDLLSGANSSKVDHGEYVLGDNNPCEKVSDGFVCDFEATVNPDGGTELHSAFACARLEGVVYGTETTQNFEIGAVELKMDLGTVREGSVVTAWIGTEDQHDGHEFIGWTTPSADYPHTAHNYTVSELDGDLVLVP